MNDRKVNSAASPPPGAMGVTGAVISSCSAMKWSPPIMPTTSSAAGVLHRYLHAASPRIRTAAVVLTDVPQGWSWGWVVGSEPPMHVIPMMAGSRKIGRVDLEDEHGRPCFRPKGRIPDEVLDKLAVAIEPHSIKIEQAWCDHLIGQAWIEPVVDPESGLVNVTLYGGTANERTRSMKVNWAKIIGPRKPSPDDVEIDGEATELVVGAREANPITVPLALVVFGGRVAIGDGIVVSDAAGDPWQRARARRVAERYVASASKTATVVLTNSPPGWDWGWVVGSEPGMHVVPMLAGRTHIGRVDLEDEHGQACFLPRGRIPTDVLIELNQAIESHRPRIEQAWTRHMATSGWIEVALDAVGASLMVMAYPGTSNERIHGFEVRWCRIIGGRRPEQEDVEIDANTGELVLGVRERRPVRVPLRRVVFPSVGARVVDSDQSARVHRVVDRYCADFLPVRA